MQNLALPILVLAGCTAPLAAAPLLLVRDGRTDYVIVVASDAAAPERTAAKELQGHLAKVTGVTVAIRGEAEVAGDAKQIVVGPSKRAKAILPALDTSALDHDGIVMRTVGQSLVLAGRRPRGTLYAVYTFLEDIVGCRWWTSTESSMPTKRTLEIPDIDVAYAPPLRVREAFYRDAFNGVFAARLKCTGHFEKIPPEYGGHYRIIGWCHTFFRLLAPAKYFEQHPDWYSEINGERKAGRTQLCLTNREMREELTRNALAWIRREPDAGMISISQNDWRGRCQCTQCKAVEEEEGAASGPLIRFANAVAAQIEKEFPDLLVETLAYSYTRQPPFQVRPRQNVVVRLCSIECSYVQPLATGEQNEKFRGDIERWSAIAPKLYIWNYVTNFRQYILPHPNLRVLAPNIRLFIKHNAIGLFEQGDSGCAVGDFVRLRAWLLAHLMWNPTRDGEALTREFMQGYYGAAAPHLLAYLKLIHDAAEQSGVYLRCYMDHTSAYLTLAHLNEATRLFGKAMAAVADEPVLLRRVRRERLPLDHVWLKRYHRLERAAKGTGAEFLGPRDPVAACDEFVQLAHEHKVGSYREGVAFRSYEESLKRRFRPPGPPPESCKELSEDDWLDFQDNRLSLHGYGKWVRIVDDQSASDGQAARMPGDHFEWAVQCPLTDDMAANGPWRLYIVARCDAKVEAGLAMTMGVYDARAKRGLMHRPASIEESGGPAYHTFDLGAHNVHAGVYLWVAPPKKPEEVAAAYVDRMFMVREEALARTRPE